MRGWLLGGLSALILMGAAGAAVAQETERHCQPKLIARSNTGP
jgi:NAD(P)H-hydrate repair Nnr-like enzyme with NAD(P)H-hydrate epimerase domain